MHFGNVKKYSEKYDSTETTLIPPLGSEIVAFYGSMCDGGLESLGVYIMRNDEALRTDDEITKAELTEQTSVTNLMPTKARQPHVTRARAETKEPESGSESASDSEPGEQV